MRLGAPLRSPGTGRGRRRREAPRRLASAAGLALALLLAADAAQAQEGQQGRTQRQDDPAAERRGMQAPGEALVERFAARVGEALGLDRAQRERLAAELQRSRRERAELAQRRRELMRQLARLVTTGTPDQGRVERLFDELLELRVRQARIDVDEDRRLSEFLSPLQRARLFHLKQRLAERALDRADRRP